MTTIYTGNTSSTGFTVTSDTTGDLVLKTGGSGGTTAVTVSGTDQSATFATPISQPGAFGFRNKLINALGLINQRGYVSGTATTSENQYTLDRWRVVTSGQNLTFSTTENQVTFTAPAGGVEQVIEGLNLQTGTYVLSWTGTATATVGGVSVANGGTVNVTGGTNTTIRFIDGTFTLPQFEFGTAPSNFEYRLIGIEIDLCSRYFYAIVADSTGDRFDTGVMATSTTAIIFFSNATLRVSPTVTFSSLSINGSTFTVSSIAAVGAFSRDNNYYKPYVTFTFTGGTTTTGFAANLRASSASSYLFFDAEF